VLEDELVTRRHLVTRGEFLAIYGIGRIVPSGTMSAVAVAFGHRFGGQPGVVVALLGLVLPGFLLTVALTIAFDRLAQGGVLETIRATLLPGALALIAVAALRLGRTAYQSPPDLGFAALGFAGTLLLGVNPGLLLIAAGIAGIFLFGREPRK
jgi:chromate transporter